MKRYGKTNNVFKKNPKTNKLLSSQWTLPEFEYLKNCQWHFTEKIDGTSMRLIYDPKTMVLPPVIVNKITQPDQQPRFSLRGRSDGATVHPNLATWRGVWSDFALPLAAEMFDGPVCIYGEGCGDGIRKGGKRYGATHFRAFAIKIDEWWLKPEDVEDICRTLKIRTAPHILTGTLKDGINSAQLQSKTMIGPEPGCHLMEGLIGVPTVPFLRRNGQRVVVKLKHESLKGMDWYNGTD